jgi:hypothetical protein
VPAAPSHDELRFTSPLVGFGLCGPFLQECGTGVYSGHPSNVPPRPYLQNPTTCGVTLSFGADIAYYTGDTFHAETPWPATTGCDQLSFNPSLTATPTTTQADTASGIDIDLKVPQTQSPTTPSPSEIRTATVTLPEGFSINPNAADGKLGCSDADTAIGTRNPATCPEFAKVATLSLDIAALPGPIPGAMYLGDPKPGERYRLILTADGFATHVKLVGSVQPDPATGQLTFGFHDLPQQVLQEFKLHFFGSERGALATPTRCGTYPVNSEFVPWDSALPSQQSTSYFTIDSAPAGGPCPDGARPFDPDFLAGSLKTSAAAHSPFSLRIGREDGDQNLTGLTVRTPPGWSATLAGIPYCPAEAIDEASFLGYSGLSEQFSPACPIASRIGTAVAAVGAGTHPLYVSGKVFLAGPYRDSPLSIVVVIPAVSGPYDLGNVVVRAAVDVNPTSAQLTTVSDPLPQILGGIPLRTRSIQVDLDRPGFAQNPTNCEPSAVAATISGAEGAASSRLSQFQVANCVDLPYSPKLSLGFTGGLNRLGHPAIRAILTTTPGEANTRRVSVTLPKGELLDNAHIGTVCTRAAFAANDCPADSLIGRVEAITPQLDQPLTGSAYLRSSARNLPDIAIALSGQVDFELVGHVDSVNARLRTTFDTLPDVSISRFVLQLAGGKKGLLQNSTTLCGTSKTAAVNFTGQNGKLITEKNVLHTSCRTHAARKRHRKSHRAQPMGRG